MSRVPLRDKRGFAALQDLPPKENPANKMSERGGVPGPIVECQRGFGPPTSKPGTLLSVPPISQHHSRALSERNLRLRPSQTCGSIGGNRRLEIIDAGDVVNEALAGIVPDIDSKGEVGLDLHGCRPPARPRVPAAGWMLRPVRREGNVTGTVRALNRGVTVCLPGAYPQTLLFDKCLISLH
jgi:hypothetical protein